MGCKRSAVILAGFILGCCGTPAVADQSPEALTRAQTFVVQSMIDDAKANIGGGVVVGRDGDILTLATAAHVLQDGAAIRILDTSRQGYYAVVEVRRLPEFDLALVRVRAQPQSPRPVAMATAAPGDKVWVWGHPDGGFWSLATGVVTAVDAKLPSRNDAPRITIACDACAHGDSGSGVFNAKGELLGILTASWRLRGGPVMFLEVQPVAEFAGAIAPIDDHVAKAPSKTP